MTETDGRRVRVGLIGAGSMGVEIAQILRRNPALELAGVADVDARAASALADAYSAPSWNSHRELLESCDCDAVAVSTPHNTHRDIVVEAAAAGRHIFCEKTMAINVAECHEMIAATKAAGVKLMIGHKRRFRPAYQEIKRLLDGGDFGRPLAINVAGYFGRHIDGWWASKRACGGLLHWAGVHDVDTIRYLLGEVSLVSAVEGPKVRPELTDYADAINVAFKFRSGAAGSLQVSTFYPMATYRTSFSFQIVCENGGIAYDPRQVAVQHQLEGEPMQTTFFEGYGHDVAFDREWSNFAAWVARDEEPLLTGEDGLRCVEILQAAYISAEQSQVVKLPLDPSDRRPWA